MIPRATVKSEDENYGHRKCRNLINHNNSRRRKAIDGSMECPERENDQMRITKSPHESPGIAGPEAFDDLTEVERTERYRQLSLAVLQRYPLHNPRLEYIGQFEKVIFRVEAGESRRFAFRIHQSSISAIEPQIAWLTALSRETNLRVPEPIPRPLGVCPEGRVWLR